MCQVKLTIHLNNINYIQYIYGVCNSFLSQKQQRNTKNYFHFRICKSESSSCDSLKTSFNPGKIVFVNIKSVYISGESNTYMNITGLIILAYNSDIHLNGTLIYNNNNKASHE